MARNVDEKWRSETSSDFPDPNSNPKKPGRRSGIVDSRSLSDWGRLSREEDWGNLRWKEDWGNPSHLLIKKEEIKMKQIKHKEKIKIKIKIKQPIQIKQPIKIKQAKKEQLLIRKAEPVSIRDASVSTDTRLSQFPDPGRPVRPMDPVPICEICGANHRSKYCSYLDSMPPDAKPIDESKFQIICCCCGWSIVNEACPNYCSPTLTRVRRKPFSRLHLAPIKHLSKDLIAPGSNSSSQETKTHPSRFPKFECFKLAYSGYQPPSGKQKEASVSTETPNTIMDLSPPPGSNSSSQETNTHPLPFKL